LSPTILTHLERKISEVTLMRLQGWITKLAREKFSVKKVAAPTITILGLALAPASCFADTMYVFSGNITPYYFLPSGASQSFTYTGPDFITQGTFVPASALSECSTGYYATCGGINFLSSSPGYGVPGQVVQTAFSDGVVNPNYYFPLAAFTVPGTYSTVDYQGANTGTLIVANTTMQTPEPGPAVLLMGPLAGLFLAMLPKLAARARVSVRHHIAE
jgi:hypothetical protein